MKNRSILIIATALLFSPCMSVLGAGPVIGVITPATPERITMLTKEKGLINLGQRNGIIKGDIGSIAVDRSGAPEAVIAQCAVTTAGYQSSICEIITARKEIDPGYPISFDPVNSADATIYPIAISMLSQIVDPYPPYKHLSVCMYGIFSESGAATGFSELIERELEDIFAQKKRIGLVDKSALSDLVFYADSDGEIMKVVRESMKKAAIDVLLVGRYKASGNRIELIVRAVEGNGADRGMVFSLPVEQKYAGALGTVIVAGRETTKVETLRCTLTLKSMPSRVRREEKAEVGARESGGNAFTEHTLAKLNFNMVSPVQVKVQVDGEAGVPQGKESQVFTLTKGVHRVLVSFKRGYFYDNALLYTSEREVTKEAVLDLGTADNLTMEVRLNPLFEEAAIAINVIQRLEREQQVIKPIYRVQPEKTVEVFKD
jgi:hypothetical protein